MKKGTNFIKIWEENKPYLIFIDENNPKKTFSVNISINELEKISKFVG